MLPTCMVPASICLPPNQTISREVPFIIRVIKGIMAAITRLVNSWVRIRSVLAASKRASSCCSRLNARMGIMPVKISRDTRFSRSTSFCMILNLGMANCINTVISASNKATASTMIQVRLEPACATWMMPPMPRMGAYATMRSKITQVIWICCTSLVVRVMRDAVENLSVSEAEKLTTRRNTPRRRSRAMAAATREASSPTRTAAATINRVSPSIRPPVCIR